MDNEMVETIEMNVEQTRRLRKIGSTSTLVLSVDKGIRETFGLEAGQMVTIVFKTLYKGKEVEKKILEKPVEEIEKELEQQEELKETAKYQEEMMQPIIKNRAKTLFK